MISSLSRYRKKLTTKWRKILFIKAETGQQSPRQCPDGNRHSDDGKPKDIVQRYRGKGTKSNGEIQHNDEPEQDDEEVQG